MKPVMLSPKDDHSIDEIESLAVANPLVKEAHAALSSSLDSGVVPSSSLTVGECFVYPGGGMSSH
jgi:hypothetical protein